MLHRVRVTRSGFHKARQSTRRASSQVARSARSTLSALPIRYALSRPPLIQPKMVFLLFPSTRQTSGIPAKPFCFRSSSIVVIQADTNLRPRLGISFPLAERVGHSATGEGDPLRQKVTSLGTVQIPNGCKMPCRDWYRLV